MAYLTLAQGKQILGERIYESAYINISTDLVDDDILTEDINFVSDVIDSYLKRIYNSAITGEASLRLLKGLAEYMLIHKAYSRFDSARIPENVTENFDRAIFRLKDIASGAIPLPDEAQDIQESKFTYAFKTGRGTNGNTNHQVFNRSSMGRY